MNPLAARRLFLTLAAALPGMAAHAQTAPPAGQVVRIVVPFTAGGSTDVTARAVATQLGQRLGTSVIVENRAGGGGLIGAAAVAKGPKDGTMLLMATGSLMTSAATTPNVPFDVNRDLVPVALIGEGPMVVAVSTKTDIKTPADFVAAARARPNTLTYGTAGVGTIGHLGGELINEAAKIQTQHVPYKGTSQALVDLGAGTIDATVAIYSTLAPQIKAGRVRLVGVTSRQPNPAFPGIQPMASAAPGLHATTWVAAFAPAGTPAPLIQRLNRELQEIAKSKEVAEQMAADGNVASTLTPQELVPFMRDSYTQWKNIATSKKIVAD